VAHASDARDRFENAVQHPAGELRPC
jgi:hypothetical protein